MSVADDRTASIRRYSKWAWPIAFAFILIGDLFGVPNPGRGDTPSEVMRDWSRHWWFIPLVFGAVSTHFFVNFGQPDSFQIRFFVLAGIGISAIVANLVTHFGYQWIAGPDFRASMLLIGMGLGVVLWGQDS